MNLKTYDKGLYIKKCTKSDYEKPSRLERMFNVALMDKDEKPRYHLVYFKKNDIRFSKFNDKVELLVGNYYTEGELLDIVDNFSSNSGYFDREVVIDGEYFKALDDKNPFNGSFCWDSENILNIIFHFESEGSFSGKYRFIPKI
ncbi:hypothetical protein [Lutibacter sp.]|uniref:hypothetical protein n=1 Tax=Lutibacter sp. TaxID=1925666 RepID=UPI002733991B|nr:hypothetical protein [Lutibacter sp.]MDP3314385.1 hypothetical protein [Lutibacter sp.]